MRRKSLFKTLGLFALLVLVVLGVLSSVIKREPAWYSALARPRGADRQHNSDEFEKTFYNLMNSVANREESWTEDFTEEQFNSYFQEGFLSSAGGDSNLPEGFHHPRIHFEDGRMRLGCRWGHGFWSTVVSIDVKVWLIANEVNLMAMELTSLKAGGLPVSPGILLESITEAATRANMEVTWYRTSGNPVAIVRFQKDQARPTLQLQRFETQEGKLVIQGRATEPGGNKLPVVSTSNKPKK